MRSLRFPSDTGTRSPVHSTRCSPCRDIPLIHALRPPRTRLFGSAVFRFVPLPHLKQLPSNPFPPFSGTCDFPLPTPFCPFFPQYQQVTSEFLPFPEPLRASLGDPFENKYTSIASLGFAITTLWACSTFVTLKSWKSWKVVWRMQTLRNSRISMSAYLSNFLNFRLIVSRPVFPRRSFPTGTPTPSSRPASHRSSGSTFGRASATLPCPPAMWGSVDTIQGSSGAQHDQDIVQLHTPRLRSRRHGVVVQHRRADIRSCQVRRQLQVDGLLVSLYHEARVWPRLFAVVHLVWSPEETCVHHLASRPRTLLECFIQLCDPALRLDQCSLSCSVALCSNCCKRWSTRAACSASVERSQHACSHREEKTPKLLRNHDA